MVGGGSLRTLGRMGSVRRVNVRREKRERKSESEDNKIKRKGRDKKNKLLL